MEASEARFNTIAPRMGHFRSRIGWMGSRTEGYLLLWTLALPVFVEGTLGSLSRLVEVCRRGAKNELQIGSSR